MSNTHYCFDTSSFIAAWDERYPIDTFPSLWEEVSAAIGSGVIVSPEEVRRELMTKSSALVEWTKAHADPFIPTDEEVLMGAIEVLKVHARLVAAGKQASSADPFVISLARSRGLTVVTEESPGTHNKPKIPFVCGAYRVRCISLLEFLRAEKWVIGKP
jgi:hypothetical protein